MSDSQAQTVDGLYRQLALERAEQVRAKLAEVGHERGIRALLAQSAQGLEDAAGVLLHTANAFAAIDDRLIADLLSEHAGALLIVAGRFEQAADLPEPERG